MICEQHKIECQNDFGVAQGYTTGDVGTITKWFTYQHDIWIIDIIDGVIDYGEVAFLDCIQPDCDLLTTFEKEAERRGARAIVAVTTNETNAWLEQNDYKGLHGPLLIKTF